jgi:hypothetical protein
MSGSRCSGKSFPRDSVFGTSKGGVSDLTVPSASMCFQHNRDSAGVTHERAHFFVPQSEAQNRVPCPCRRSSSSDWRFVPLLLLLLKSLLFRKAGVVGVCVGRGGGGGTAFL